MSSYTHFNIQFIPKNRKKVTQEDLSLLSDTIFTNSTWAEYSENVSSSWSGMFIFEIDESNNCVAFEITPIRVSRVLPERLSLAHAICCYLEDLSTTNNVHDIK